MGHRQISRGCSLLGSQNEKRQSDQHKRKRSIGIADVEVVSDSAERSAAEGNTTRERNTEDTPDRSAAMMELKW